MAPRPTVHLQIDSMLEAKFSPADHRLWWDAEHQLLSGLTAREALTAGEVDAVHAAASVQVGSAPSEPFISQERANEILASTDTMPNHAG